MNLLWSSVFPEVPAGYFHLLPQFHGVFNGTPEELKAFMYSTMLNKSLSTSAYFYKASPRTLPTTENFSLFADIPAIFLIMLKKA
jgi:hypothetical protein